MIDKIFLAIGIIDMFLFVVLMLEKKGWRKNDGAWFYEKQIK